MKERNIYFQFCTNINVKYPKIGPIFYDNNAKTREVKPKINNIV